MALQAAGAKDVHRPVGGDWEGGQWERGGRVPHQSVVSPDFLSFSLPFSLFPLLSPDGQWMVGCRGLGSGGQGGEVRIPGAGLAPLSACPASQAVFGELHRTSWQFTGKLSRKQDSYWNAVLAQGRSHENVRDTDVFLTFKYSLSRSEYLAPITILRM